MGLQGAMHSRKSPAGLLGKEKKVLSTWKKSSGKGHFKREDDTDRQWVKMVHFGTLRGGLIAARVVGFVLVVVFGQGKMRGRKRGGTLSKKWKSSRRAGCHPSDCPEHGVFYSFYLASSSFQADPGDKSHWETKTQKKLNKKRVRREEKGEDLETNVVWRGSSHSNSKGCLGGTLKWTDVSFKAGKSTRQEGEKKKPLGAKGNNNTLPLRKNLTFFRTPMAPQTRGGYWGPKPGKSF